MFLLSLEAPIDVRKKVGKAIKKARVDRVISQESVAEHAGISTSYLSQIERGTRPISTDILHRVSSSLSMTVPDLLEYAVSKDEDDPWITLMIKAAAFAEELSNAQKELNTTLRNTRNRKTAKPT